MLQRLPDDHDKPEGQQRTPEQIRREFDQAFVVSAWESPGGGFALDTNRDPHAPSWWVSDEEASAPWIAMAGLE